MKIILDLILCFCLSFIPAGISYFLDYCLGHPAGEFSTKEIFSNWTLFLAKRRIGKKKEGEFVIALKALLDSDDEETRSQGQDQLKKSIVLSARNHFTWEKIFGMCIICSNFWTAQIAAFFFYRFIPLNFIAVFNFFILIPLFSHVILRKL